VCFLLSLQLMGELLGKNPYVGMRVTDEVRDALEAAAAAEERSVSQWARLAVIEVLRRKGFLAPKDKPPKRPQPQR